MIDKIAQIKIMAWAHSVEYALDKLSEAIDEAECADNREEEAGQE